DFGEDGEIGDAQRVVALAVETNGDAAEVADGRKSHGEQAVEEVPHGLAAQGDVGTDNLSLAELEVGDGLLGFGENGFLTGDGAKVALDVGDLGLVGVGVDTRVQGDLNELGDLVFVGVAAALHQSGGDLLLIGLLEERDVFAAHGK